MGNEGHRDLPHRLSADTDRDRKTQDNMDEVTKWFQELMQRLEAIEARLTAGGL